jgi:hypothetical protein
MAFMPWGQAHSILGPDDFEVVIQCCGARKTSEELRPVIQALASSGKQSLVISIVSQMRLDQEPDNRIWVSQMVASIAQKFFESDTTSQSWDDKAILSLLNTVATLEESEAEIWSSAWNRVPPVKATELMVTFLLRMPDSRLVTFLGQADALYSAKLLSSAGASSCLRDITGAAIARVKNKVAVGTNVPRPHAYWEISEVDELCTWNIPENIVSFLLSSCQDEYVGKLPKHLHSSLVSGLYPIIDSGKIMLDFFQRYGRGT